MPSQGLPASTKHYPSDQYHQAANHVIQLIQEACTSRNATQEFARRHINVRWVPTRDVIADGIAKALGKQKHQNFMKMINLGMGNRIPREQHQDELKEQIQKARVQGVEDEPVQ
jgi:hypothetical protein